jgi:putative spermidine/putrescine transport system permease protein
MSAAGLQALDLPRRLFQLALPSIQLPGIVAWCGYLFLLSPILVVIPMSLDGSSQMEFPPHQLSLRLYTQYFASPGWRAATLQSLLVATSATVFAVIVAVPAAFALVRTAIIGRRILILLLISPMLTPGVVMGLGYELYFGRLGLAGTTVGIALAHATLVSPFVLIVAMSGFRHLDANLETAARVMGAGPVTIFRRVILPQVKVAVLGGAVLAFAISFDEVVIAYFLSGATSATLPVRMYSTIQWEISPIIAAISSLLTLVSLVVALALMCLQSDNNTASR